MVYELYIHRNYCSDPLFKMILFFICSLYSEYSFYSYILHRFIERIDLKKVDKKKLKNDKVSREKIFNTVNSFRVYLAFKFIPFIKNYSQSLSFYIRIRSQIDGLLSAERFDGVSKGNNPRKLELVTTKHELEEEA